MQFRTVLLRLCPLPASRFPGERRTRKRGDPNTQAAYERRDLKAEFTGRTPLFWMSGHYTVR